MVCVLYWPLPGIGNLLILSRVGRGFPIDKKFLYFHADAYISHCTQKCQFLSTSSSFKLSSPLPHGSQSETPSLGGQSQLLQVSSLSSSWQILLRSKQSLQKKFIWTRETHTPLSVKLLENQNPWWYGWKATLGLKRRETKHRWSLILWSMLTKAPTNAWLSTEVA